MMVADLPPQSAIECPASIRLDAEAAQAILKSMKERLPGTKLMSADVSPLCGLVMLTTESGNKIFTDKAGRYFVIGLLLDTATGRTLDGTKQLNRD